MSINSKLFEQPPIPEPDTYQQAMQAQESVESINSLAPLHTETSEEGTDFDGNPEKIKESIRRIQARHNPPPKTLQEIVKEKGLDPKKFANTVRAVAFAAEGELRPELQPPETETDIERALREAEGDTRRRSLQEFIQPTSRPEIYAIKEKGLEAITLDTDDKLRCVSRKTSVRTLISTHKLPYSNTEGSNEYTKKMEVTKRLDDELGLEDLSFKVYRGKEMETIGKPIAIQNSKLERDGKKPHIYLLMHGWTGTHEIFEIDMIQKIIDTDPDAIIIAPDGNGFGESSFKSTLNGSKLEEKCTIQKYADQMMFLMQDVLGLNDQQIADLRVCGHSMGGACAMLLAARGVGSSTTGRIVAVAPALLAPLTKQDKLDAAQSREELKDTEKFLSPSDDYPSPHERNIGIVYGGLWGLMGIADTFKKLPFMTETGKLIISQTFQRILGKILMGHAKNGDVDQADFALFMRELDRIHDEQLKEKSGLASASMRVLNRGIDPSTFTDQELILMGSNTNTIEGKGDNLGTGSGYEKWVKALQTLGYMNRHIIKNAGHYAPVFSPELLAQLIPEKRYAIKFKRL